MVETVSDDATSSEARTKVDWLRASETGFGDLSPEQEFPHDNVGTDAFSATETWWFEAIDAPRDLIASFYISRRPNLGMCSAGAWMWRGMCREQILADHLNYQIYLEAPHLSGTELSVPHVGLTFDFIEPFKTTAIRYDPPGVDCKADLVATALMRPAVRANNKHFEQSIWVKGTITIGSDRFDVDGPSIRDRSWGEARPEDQIAHPPIGWMYGNIDGGRISFNLSGCDDPAHGPVWTDAYGLGGAAAFYDGWINIDGDLRRVVSLSKRTQRLAEDRMRPVRIEAEFVDDCGETHRLIGHPRTAFWMHHWPNLNAWFGLTDWELDGETGFGEAQDYAWPDYCKRYWR